MVRIIIIMNEWMNELNNKSIELSGGFLYGEVSNGYFSHDETAYAAKN